MTAQEDNDFLLFYFINFQIKTHSQRCETICINFFKFLIHPFLKLQINLHKKLGTFQINRSYVRKF